LQEDPLIRLHEPEIDEIAEDAPAIRDDIGQAAVDQVDERVVQRLD